MDSPEIIRAHIFTNIPERLIFRLSPGFSRRVGNVVFSFGLEIPEDIDVLLVYIRAGYSIRTRLPKDRTIFFAGEPDVIHPYNAKFLNQFGLVHTSSPRALATEKVWGNLCCMPFVGVDFTDLDNPLPLTWFADLPCPIDKTDKISIVTSTKVHTPYQRARLDFVNYLIANIPDRIELFGNGHRSVDDKKDALLPSKYHIALENGGGPFAWTEKLSDPLLCYALPFYYGADNVDADLPAGCIEPIDITRPEQAVAHMMRAVSGNLWEARLDQIKQARHLILTEHNLVHAFARLVNRAMQKAPLVDTGAPRRLIRSERSFLPEPGQRGGVGQMILRRAVTAVIPDAELRIAPVQAWLEHRRSLRRIKRRRRKEAGQTQ